MSTLMRPVLGIDPGRSGAMALVAFDAATGFHYLWGGNVYGSSSKPGRTNIGQERTWGRRLDAALEELHMAAPDGLLAAYVEEPAAKAKSKRGKRGPDAFLRLGCFQGRLLEAIRREFGIEPEKITVESWTGISLVGSRKRLTPFGTDVLGWHRVAEAEMRLLGFVAPPPTGTDAAKERIVARSEAALVALAGAKLERRARS